jgi:hypothetical protein
MSRARVAQQPDLFALQADQSGGNDPVYWMEEPPPEDFIQRIRDELLATLAMVQTANSLPWPNLTRMTLAELRFNSITNWLPKTEAVALRTEFAAAMVRIYAIVDAAAGYDPLPPGDTEPS